MAQSITSADLRHKVVFKQPTSSLNDEAGIEKSYSTSFEIFAAKRRPSKQRVTEANTTTMVGQWDFIIRNSEDPLVPVNTVEYDWLIEYKGKDYTIDNIEPIDADKEDFIQFTAKVRTNG